jgi:ribulose-5-phosphate 4-epimerase/fuculose-1-phosphate aldolase
MDYQTERADLAAAFRWAAREGMHEAVANHFSLAVSADGSQFLMNPNQMHFARIKASDMLLIDANDPETMARENAPDPTAWGLHASVHRLCPHIKCLMHAHSDYATVLASLADSTMLPIDQNTATFFNRIVYDEQFGGLAFESEGIRCAGMMKDPLMQVMVMGNHGVLVAGESVADTYSRLYHFERAAGTFIRALQTGRPLRVLSDEIAEKTAVEMAGYPQKADRHFGELKRILNEDGSTYAS